MTNKKILSCITAVSLCLSLLSACDNKSDKGSNKAGVETNSSESVLDSVAEKIADPDFRNTKWGMTKEQVKNSEEISIFDEDDSNLLYEGLTVSNMNASLMYTFDSDHLYRGFYKFEESHTSYNLYITDYENLVKALTEKYGAPKWDRTKWIDNLWEGDKNDLGMAVATGGLIYGALWETPTTKITVNLIGDNFDIRLTCTYVDIDYEDGSATNTDGL